MRIVPEVVIGTPRGGSVTHPFSVSLNALQYDQYSLPRRERSLVGLIEAAGLYIEDNRGFISRRFLNEHQAEWLLMIDSDIEFPPTLIDQMLEVAVDSRRVIAGNVTLGADPCVGYYASPQPGVFLPLQCLPEAKVFEVDAAATAIMLIHREVLEAIREREGECWFYRHKVEIEQTNGYQWKQWLNLGEDISFCLRARDAGFKTWVVRRLTGVKHHKVRGLVEEE